MAIKNTSCSCGAAVTIRSGSDARVSFRRDGKQVVYTEKPLDESGREYDIFRCEYCMEPIHETCAEAKYE